MKRISAVLFALLVLGAVAWGAGSPQQAATSPEEKLVLTFWVPLGFKQQTVMNSWDSIAFFPTVEERLNVKLEFLHPPVGGEVEQRNTMIAARNLPDVMYTYWDTIAGGPAKMIADGIIHDIHDVALEHAPNLQAYWADNPELRAYTYTDEGQLFGMPYYWPEQGGYLFHFGYVVRGDWAEKLNVPHPTDVASWHRYLTAVKNGDPNGNGQRDELPLIAQGFAGLLETQRMYGIQPNQLFYDQDGTIVSAIEQPAYREWLQTMARWYTEGLVDPDVLSTNRAMLDNKVLTNLAGAYWSGAGTGQLGLYMRQKQNAGDTVFSLDPVPMPTTAQGERLGWLKIVSGAAGGITTSNRNVERTVEYFDYYFTREGHLLSQLGPEGKAYNMVNGEVRFTEYATNNPDGLSFDSAVILQGLAPMDFIGYQLADYWKFNISFTPQAASSDAVWGDYTHHKLLTGLRFTTAESSTVARITNDVRTLVEETVSKIILGQLPISAYDQMVTSARRAGLDELKAIHVDAWARRNAR